MRSHRLENGGFRNPWLEVDPGQQRGAFWRWQRERLRKRAQLPRRADARVPVATPSFDAPRAAPDALTATWIGQSSWLLQIGGLNVLTDPVFSRRASPFAWAGPARLHPPGVALDALPPIDVVLLSHDHYDHLDERSVRALRGRFGEKLLWVAPLGFVRWLEKRDVYTVIELDWWRSLPVPLPNRAGVLDVTATPAQHWCKRGPGDARRLWCSFALRTRLGPNAAEARPGPSAFFMGDSGYCPVFREIGERLGPFDLSLLPIGAYEPRWFMKAAHMNPEEAVQTYVDLGGRGAFAGMHWGTFILTDEPVAEPPERTRAEWTKRGLPAADLRLSAIGETIRL